MRGRPRKPKFIAVDFFCGAGGTTQGLIQAGGFVLAGIDNDTGCASTYTSNNYNRSGSRDAPAFLNLDVFPKTGRYKAGQQEELFGELEELIYPSLERFPDVPLLFSICAPCQPFTKISKGHISRNRQERRQKDRNLLSETTKFIEHFGPDLVFAENVPTIGQAKFGNVWNRFSRSLVEFGYVTGDRVVCTSKFGIPQRRKRSILLAVDGELVKTDFLCDLFGDRMHVPDTDSKSTPVSVKQAIGHFPPLAAGEANFRVPNHRSRRLSGQNLIRLAKAKPGANNSYLNDPKEDLSLACHERVNSKWAGKTCFGDVYTRLHPDKPSSTITTKAHSVSNGRFGHFDTKQVRGLSVREAASLQSFPEDYVFYPETEMEGPMRMIGNAVPPKLAKFFADYLVASID